MWPVEIIVINQPKLVPPAFSSFAISTPLNTKKGFTETIFCLDVRVRAHRFDQSNGPILIKFGK